VQREHATPEEVSYIQSEEVAKKPADTVAFSKALDTLKLFLPDSAYYSTLSSLPPPDLTAPESTTTFEAQSLLQNSLPIITEITAQTESTESKSISDEIDRRRKRLTTTTSAEETRRIVLKEIMYKSPLPDLYDQILNHHSAPDEMRRETEVKLLRHLHTTLQSLPSPFLNISSTLSESALAEKQNTAKIFAKQKVGMRGRIEELVNGMITLKIEDELAWQIGLEWPDLENEKKGWDEYNLKRYMNIYPE
jgi:superkiller protein 3